jgi:DNA-binding transcriptional LysR family regulator
MAEIYQFTPLARRPNLGHFRPSDRHIVANRFCSKYGHSSGVRRPAIDLRVSATMHHVDFSREDVDVAVRHGDGNWPGLERYA